MDGRWVLISPYDPAAGFNVGNAMQRNKLIYALADAALVVTSDFEKGGTRAGAIEQLDRLHVAPVFVCNGTNAGKGNSALPNCGGKPWPNPQSGYELGRALIAAAEAVTAEPKQDTLPLTLRGALAVHETTPGHGPEPRTLNPRGGATKWNRPRLPCGKWMADFEVQTQNRNLVITKTFLWYTTCPKCAKEHGKNYVAILGKTN